MQLASIQSLRDRDKNEIEHLKTNEEQQNEQIEQLNATINEQNQQLEQRKRVTDEELVRAKMATLQGEAAKGRSPSSSGAQSSAAKKQDKKLTTKDYENMLDDFAFSKNSRINAEEELTTAMDAFYDEQMEERRLALAEIQKTVDIMM